MTAGEKRRAKKAHAEFMAAQGIDQPSQQTNMPKVVVTATRQPRMKPTREAMTHAEYDLAPEVRDGPIAIRKIKCRLDKLKGRKLITRQQHEAGMRFEADHIVAWGSAGSRDSCVPSVGGMDHETPERADKIVRAKSRMNRILNMVGPACYNLLRNVAIYDMTLGKQNTLEGVRRYKALNAALDAAAKVYGVCDYEAPTQKGD